MEATLQLVDVLLVDRRIEMIFLMQMRLEVNNSFHLLLLLRKLHVSLDEPHNFCKSVESSSFIDFRDALFAGIPFGNTSFFTFAAPFFLAQNQIPALMAFREFAVFTVFRLFPARV